MAVVLVTGGSSGIGLATVRRLAAAGDTVIAAARRPERMPSLDRSVRSVAFDVAGGDASALVASVVEHEGRLDGLVNNAGMVMSAAVTETSDAAVHDVFETNLFGPLRLCRAALAAGARRIVNVSSMNGAVPAPFAGIYSASKAALDAASLVMDAEVRPFGAAVSLVAPGFFRTEMASGLADQPIPASSTYRRALEQLAAGVPDRLTTAGDPDDVAAAIEACLRSEDPPARVVVGRDAESMESLVRGGSTDDFARLLRDLVVQLLGRENP